MIILSGQTKGGVGKSMIAANIAVARAKGGHSVLLLDADRQKTSRKWADTRVMNAIEPEITCAALFAEDSSGKEFRNKIKALMSRYDDIIIDSGGHDSRELRAAITLADMLIAPVAPSLPDLWGLKDFDEVLGQLLPANPELQAHVVINKANPLNIGDTIGQAIEAMKSLENLTFSHVVLRERPTYQAAYQEGMAALDLNSGRESEVKAAAEIGHLMALIEGKNHD